MNKPSDKTGFFFVEEVVTNAKERSEKCQQFH